MKSLSVEKPMANHTDISIITVVFNGEKHIKPTVESVLNQTFTNYEYLIIDGKSTDQTLDIVNQYRTQVHKIISEPDRGVYDAMNKGLELASGTYVLFLNAGDELASPNTLGEIFNSSNRTVDLFYGETVILNVTREPIGTRTELTSRILPNNLTAEDFLNGQVVSHQSFIPKRSLCKAYSLKYTCSADIDWQLDILTKAKSIVKTKSPISKYLQGGISDTQLSTCWKERFQILLKHFNWFRVFWQHFKFAVRFLKNGAYKS